jgi:two-component SAPR family response regulator
VVEKVISFDPPLARYVPLSSEQLRGRGVAPALQLLKMLLGQPQRFALKDWMPEQICHDRDLFTSARLENIVWQLRSIICPPAYEDLRAHLVTLVRGSTSSGNGYQLAVYPLIWTDLAALTWNVEQATRIERFGDNPLPYWERAYALAKRGPYLPDELYSDWAAVRRGEVAGILRQSVQAIARLYLEQHGKAGEEEALLLLRSYWQEPPQEEDVLRPLMELLGKRERYQEALEYYERLQRVLKEDEHEPDPRTQDVAEYLKTKQIKRFSEKKRPFSSLNPN